MRSPSSMCASAGRMSRNGAKPIQAPGAKPASASELRLKPLRRWGRVADWTTLPDLGAPRPAADEISARNRPYVQPNLRSSYNTQLAPLDEMAFRGWLKKNNVPFDPNAAGTDYDMRGF